MSKIAFMFPGQGAQKIGMGKDFYDNIPAAKRVFEISSDATGLDVAKLCFEENDNINITEFTQVALLTTEVAILRAIEEKGAKPDYCFGLSLGEYGALAAANVMSDEDLFKVIRNRGKFMQDAYPTGGAMAAVLALDVEIIKEVLDSIDGIVSIANDNCPGQIVITGEKNAVDEASVKLKEAGAKRCLPLNVSGPFHSELLQYAGEKLAGVLLNVDINDPIYPYVSNVTADIVTSKIYIKDLLAKQVSSSVRFRESILKLRDLGVTKFVEIGPGKTLSGFVGKTDAALSTYSISTVENLALLDEIYGWD